MIYLFIIILIFLIYYYYSEYNTEKVCIRGEPYRVHNNYDDKSKAAETLAELNRRIVILKKHMLVKYSCRKDYCAKIIRMGIDEFNMQDRTKQLVENYKANISEISPNNPLGSTSFTEGKSKIVFCIRDAETKKIHDINTLTFVALHEITHVMNEKWGHGAEFWNLFHVVLLDAVSIGIYQPINYSIAPAKYCGIVITSSPLF